MKIAIATLFASLWFGPAHARDLESAARQAYRACQKETAADRSACTFGGCGLIEASCRDRQVAVYERDSEAIAQVLATAGDRCAEAAAETAKEIDAFQGRLQVLQPWNSTWSGLEWGVEVAAFKNRSLRLLRSACAPDPVVPRTPGGAARAGTRSPSKGPFDGGLDPARPSP